MVDIKKHITKDNISLIVSLLAIFFSFYTYNRRNTDSIESKQIDVVTDLVRHIETTFIQTDLIH